MNMKNIIIKCGVIFFSIGFLVSCSNTPNKDLTPPETQLENAEQTAIEETIIYGLPPKIVAPKIIEPEPEPEPKRIKQRELTHTERFSGMLNAHNRVRASHGVPPLKWSKKLEQHSLQWAKQLSKKNKCDMYHRKGNPFGENLYRSTAIVWTDGERDVNPVSIKHVVKAWTDEKKWYNYKTNSCRPGAQCGHYTQAIWKSTTEVGCAMQVCGDKSQTWVCSYNPPGNYRGVRPY